MEAKSGQSDLEVKNGQTANYSLNADCLIQHIVQKIDQLPFLFELYPCFIFPSGTDIHLDL